MNPGLIPATANTPVQRFPILRVAAGQPVYLEGDLVAGLFRLRDGVARMTKLTPGGRTVTVRHVLPGDYFGEEVFCRPERSGEVQALTDLAIEMMPPTVSDLATLMQVSRSISEQLLRTQHFHEHLQLGEVPERIARYLLELVATPLLERDSHERPLLRISHEFIAQGTGASRETTSKVLAELRAEGFLETGYRSVTLVDMTALTRLARRAFE
jgi:CRP/FNR family transcriptional regulator, LitR-dependent transcriptional activator